ncbi:uncharacterized protein LOC110033318 [Phalaenopsis equestris]|uniref:uncharacterized protein LOC110033318 n=1 Tax=Phalaenopsis equestris TaxID=78828 RepID=UPI0009E2B02E|nr:uncharacterized protein LOC110033318 [Phalaenopsis equestris]
MLNTSLTFPLTFLPSSPFLPSPSHGFHPTMMFLFPSFSHLSFLFLLLHFFAFLLSKLFSFLHRRAISKRDDKLCISDHENKFVSSAAAISDELYRRDDIIADIILGGDAMLFLYGASCKNDALLGDQETDSNDQILLGEHDNFVLESEYGSSQGNISNPTDGYSVSTATNKTGTSDCLVSLDNNNIENDKNQDEEKSRVHEESVKSDLKKKDLTEDEKLLEAEVPNFRVEQVQQERETFGGSLTGESTSKSSIEWRSSTIFRDSETEYPFSSSSRRSASNWEFYTLFKKYDEEMFYFDRISAQKLAETESFRLINAQPRSISKRIVGKLMAKPGSNSMRMRDPYQDLESAYVAQICLAWEALNWNYNIFLRSKGNKLDMDGSVCHARIAQRFQQFQVLLQRFIENEPYEYGRRPEIFARMRLSSPKLLQVPEFLGSEGDEENQGMDSSISSAEFLSILEEAIQTFMNFLKADKKTPCERLKAFIKRKQSAADLTYLRLLKKINKQKKARMEEIGRRRKFWKKRKPKGEEEMETFMAIIDIKVVSRVLRVQEITEEQLHWCEDKMSKVRVWDGKMQRDHSLLFFPVH